MVCGSFCEASACAGFNVEEEADGGLSCTSLATVTNVTADNSTNFYCAGDLSVGLFTCAEKPLCVNTF